MFGIGPVVHMIGSLTADGDEIFVEPDRKLIKYAPRGWAEKVGSINF